MQTSFFSTASKSGVAKTRQKATHVTGTKGVSKTQGTVYSMCFKKVPVSVHNGFFTITYHKRPFSVLTECNFHTYGCDCFHPIRTDHPLQCAPVCSPHGSVLCLLSVHRHSRLSTTKVFQSYEQLSWSRFSVQEQLLCVCHPVRPTRFRALVAQSAPPYIAC